MKSWLTAVVLVVCSMNSWANHIIGGDISVTRRSTSSNDFTITLTLIYDANLRSTEDNAFVSIFRKSDNSRIEDLTLVRVAKQELPYTNARCVGSPSDAKNTLIRYTVNATFSAAAYNAAGGFYLAWEECCRNGNLLNIQTPSRVGLVFYAELPPLATVNSSPAFKAPEIKYICVGKDVEADFSATDTDKDELTYSIVTPFIGSTDGGGTFPTKAQSGPYKRAAWANGFDSTKAISGKTPLTIDPKTGKITVNASQLGSFAFAVRCEEYRNGAKIGEVRREFVFQVVDCVSTPPSAVFINVKSATSGVVPTTQSNGHVSALTMCGIDSAVLKPDDEDPQWAYEWQRDGKKIEGNTSASLVVKQAGVYTLLKRFAQSCSAEEVTTNTTTVNLKSTPSVKITSSRPLPFCDSDSTNLSIETAAGSTVTWKYNGQAVGSNASTLYYVKQAGMYQVTATDGVSQCQAKDSVVVKLIAGPPAPISISGPPIFCANDSVKLSTPDVKTYEYVWYQDRVPIFSVITNELYPQKSGKYSVAVVDTATRCATRSLVLEIVVKPSPKVTLDSIAPLCTTALQAITLRGTPAGGVFSGNGVTGNRFVSQNLAAGSYPITYTYTNPEGCSAKATRFARLSPPPRIDGTDKWIMVKGDSIELRMLPPLNSTVSWFPSIGLSNPTAPRPYASPDRTTTYTFTVSTPEGCVSEKKITVIVVDLNIPNGFTPNDDGSNDTWEIGGITEYPNCTVEVLNRWGNVVFSSKGYTTPWDGRWNGELVPVGMYYYQIYLREVEHKFTGSLSVIR